MLKIVVLALIGLANAAYYEELTERIVNEVNNNKDAKWKAGYNKYFAGRTEEQMKRLMGTKMDVKPSGPFVYPQPKGALPDTFDARQQWSQCSSIGFIRDQADCGSCWAFSTTEAMSDRHCIKSNGQLQPYISEEQVMSCCSACGSGCDGGYPLESFKYWMRTGVVTGGPYASKQGCQPYLIPPCGPNGCTGPEAKTPACQSTCESGYTTSFSGDKHYGSSAYMVQNGPTGMQQELFENGPIVAAFSVYEDFYSYVSGVYHHVSGRYVGGHAVKVVGWGTENNTPYWLVANSWNATWGMNGFFMIERGIDECGFESSVSAGEPK